MARPLRIEYPGAWYHVLNRGRRKEKVFFQESDYPMFMDILEESTDVFNLEVHAYSFIPNHYHLLIRTPDGNLSRIMRHINGSYTQKINRRYGFEGSLFKGRFKSILVEEEAYLLEIIRYIHRNPLKAGLEKKLGEHKWTSCYGYNNIKKRPGWLKTESVLRYFSEYDKEALRKMNAYVRKAPPRDLERRLESLNWPAILGGSKFIEEVKKKIRGKKIDKAEIPQYKKSFKNMKTKEIIGKILEEYKIEEEMFYRKRDKKNANIKKGYIYVCRKYLQKANREIKESLGGVSLSFISKQYNSAVREIKEEEGCYSDVMRIKELIKC